MSRAPWSIPSSSASSGAAPGAGASLTRAPWATSVGAGAASSDAAAAAAAAVTRAPWLAQGVAIAHSSAQDTINFDIMEKQQPEYHASIAAAEAAAATASTAAAASSSAAAAAAAPSALAVSPLLYFPPCKLIRTPPYLPLWRDTCAYAELTSFILLLNERVRGVKVKPAGQLSRRYSISPKVQCLINWIDESKAAIAQIPPIQQSMRFGNKAFRVWHEQRISGVALQPLMLQLLGSDLMSSGAANELIPYLQDSFGSTQRIDYGTGHELNFVLFLCALNKLGVFNSDDSIALVLEVFRSYILLMEELQSVYWLEPAGSKGAWGLDDYQFLVFLWGSSQLIGSSLAPSDFLQEGVADDRAPEYLFLTAIRFIHRMKSGPFHEHSSFLHHISTLPSWSKANSGLVKMYEAEVLNKFPIVQHVLFGRILKFTKYIKEKETLGVQRAMEEEEGKKKKKEAATTAATVAMTSDTPDMTSAGDSTA